MARILVIDDDQGVRDSMARMLRGAGFNVETAPTGEEGVAAAKGNVFDVILSDMRMPGISGIDVLQKLRELRVDSAFIVMTGFGTVDTAVEAMKLGAVDFVQKPFFRDELLMRVRSAADRRGLARQVDCCSARSRRADRSTRLIGDSEPMRQDQGPDRPRRGRDRDGADHRRDRHRQGARGARAPLEQRARRQAVRRAQLRGADRLAARERAVRARARRVHRRGRGRARG